MHATGARGYPMFVAQAGNTFLVLPHERFYGDPDGFAGLVSEALAPQ